ncbi:MAG: FAD-dependent oxidoreductase [Chlamydiota bacterium]
MKIIRRVFACFFIGKALFLDAVTVTVAGTGVTGLWSAYSICKELKEQGQGDATLIIIGKWDWQAELKKSCFQDVAIFSHEASGFGPIGIQPHSGLLWNTDNEVIDLVKKGIGQEKASFYTSNTLNKEGTEFLELYVGWHGRHLDRDDPGSSYRRQGDLVAINRYCRELWGDFNSLQEGNVDLYLEGAWRIYDNPVQFAAALKSLEILENFDYGAEAVHDSKELARRIPFYQKIILETNSKGIFFKEDGFLDSNKLRHFLWAYLTEEKQGKPRVIVYQDSEVIDIIKDEKGACAGVCLADGKQIYSDVTVLAMGLDNKTILKQHEIELPLWSVWGAAVKARLVQELELPPSGGVSFHSQRCITASPDKKIMTIAGISMVLSEKEEPYPSLYQEKLTKSLIDIFDDRVDMTSLQFKVAPRTGIPDDLPVIGLDVPGIKNLIVLNPTSHLGNTQSIGLGKIAALGVLKSIGVNVTYPEALQLDRYRLDRFQGDIQKVRSDQENKIFILK